MGIYDGVTRKGVLVMLLASFGALLFGFDNGWWGTILGSNFFLCYYGEVVEERYDVVGGCSISTPMVSLGSAIQSAGIMIGCIVAVFANDHLGRRRSLLLTGVISIIGITIEMTSATGAVGHYTQFVIGKLINSIAMGLAANIVPCYLSETSSAAARAACINMYQAVLIIGVIIASGCVYATSARYDKSSFLIPMGVQALAPMGMISSYPFLPESPRWLVWKGRHEEAAAAADALFASPTNAFRADEYCAKLAIAYQEERAIAASIGWRDLFRGPTLRRLSIAVGIQSLQQAQGSSYMNSYIVSFLLSTGVEDIFAVIMGLYVTYALAIFTAYYLPDRFGRRPLLIGTASICAATILIIAIMSTALQRTSRIQANTAIGMIFIWYASFGVQSPLIWIVTAESAPVNHREKVIGIATFFGFGVSLIITFVAPYIQNPDYGDLGSKIGFIWGSFSLVTILWVYYMVPESKGLSLEQLDYLYDRRTPTRQFKNWRFQDGAGADNRPAKPLGPTPASESPKSALRDVVV